MYEYIWLEPILDKLADIYLTLDVPARDRVAGAVEKFNARLAADPLDVGESRFSGYRVAFLPFLVVTFYVDEAARRVEVTGVSRYGR